MLLVRQDERRRHSGQRDGNFSDDVIARLMNARRRAGVSDRLREAPHRDRT